jgi:hypothetical protein
VLLWLEGKRVNVDADRWDVGVVLVWLNQVEVGALTNLEAVVAVELEERGNNWVATSHALDTGDRVARLKHGAVPPVRVVEWLLTLPWVDDVVIARCKRVALDDPDELLAWVVEVELELVGRRGDRLTTSELEDVDEVLVRDLSELATLISVEVDVIDVERGSGEAALVDTVADGVRVLRCREIPAEVLKGIELEVDADFVVLKGDEWEGETWVAAEPELEWDVQGVHGRARGDDLGGEGLTAIAVVVAVRTTLVEEVGELWNVADHLGITSLLAGLLSELVPNVKPITIVLIDALTTDLNLDVVDEIVTNPVEPTELRSRAVGCLELNLRQSRLEVHAVDEVTIALNGASNLLAEVGSTVKRVLNRLHGKVGVATIDHLEKSDLWITS